MNQSNDKDNALSVQDSLQNQVIDLQMNLAHLEVTVERLDEVIARQDKDIQALLALPFEIALTEASRSFPATKLLSPV